MIVSNISKSVLLTDTAVTNYAFPFKVFDASQIYVVIVADHTKAETALILNMDYSVSGAGQDTGGTVTLTPSGAAKAGTGNKLVILRQMPFTQEVDYRPHDVFPAETHERTLDLLTMEVQEIREQIGRAIVAPADASAGDVTYAGLVELGDRAESEADRAQSMADKAEGTLAETKTVFDDASLLLRQAQDAQHETQQRVDGAAVRIESAMEEALVGVAKEGGRQIEKIAVAGAEQTELARGQALLAQGWSQAAETAAALARDLSGIGPASRSRYGFVRIGDGMDVDADGTISVRLATLVSTPNLSFPAVVGIGYPYIASMSAESAVPGVDVVTFQVSFGTQDPIEVAAVNNQAEVTLTPDGAAGSAGVLSVVAVDGNGNLSLTARVSFVQHAVVIGEPFVVFPPSGARDVSLTPTIHIQSAAIAGVSGTAVGTQIQLSLEEDFASLCASYGGDDLYATEWATAELPELVTLYARARHRYELYGWGGWGPVSSFSTLDAIVTAPSVLSPPDGAKGVALLPAVHVSAFANTGPADFPISTEIQISADETFAELAASYNGDYTTVWTPEAEEALALESDYYARARHLGQHWGWSDYSSVNAFTTLSAFLRAPVISAPADGATDLYVSPAIVTGAAELSGQSVDGKQIQLSKAADFASIAWDSGQVAFEATNTVNATLAVSTLYYARVRFHGTVTGWSDWSETVRFTTQSASVNQSWSVSTAGTSTFTVPVTGKYSMEVYGGGGGIFAGQTSSPGGYAKSVNLTLAKGKKLTRVVGAAGASTSFGGDSSSCTSSGSGTGGSSSVSGYLSATGGGGKGVSCYVSNPKGGVCSCTQLSGSSGKGSGGNSVNKTGGGSASGVNGKVVITYTGPA